MKKLIEITPKKYACHIAECPAVFKTDTNTYLIIGKIHNPRHPMLEGRVGPDEFVIEIPMELLDEALISQIK